MAVVVALMPASVILPSFAAGELDPALHGRVDLAKYHTGLATCLNWFIHAFGGASTRAGTAFVGEVLNSNNRSRIYDFQFSQVQGYALEFGDLNMRVIMNGGYVLEPAKTISSITQASPPVYNVTTHGYTTGDSVWSADIVGMTQLNSRRFRVTVLDANNFSLVGFDSTSYGVFVSGAVARIYTLATPYLVTDLPLLKFVQSADTLTIDHPSYEPRNLTRTGHAAWTLTVISFVPSQAVPTGLASDAPGAAQNYGVTAINNDTGEESRAAFVTSLTDTSTISWTPAAGATYYNVYKVRNGIYGFIGQGTVSFKDAAIVADVSDTPPQGNTTFAGTDQRPGCSTYHDGRQWFARTNLKPQTLYSSQSAAFNNLDVSTPTRDSDAIIRTIASQRVDEIRFLLSLNFLLVFTSGALWRAWSGWQEEVITPANLAVRPMLYEGIAQVPPIPTVDSALFVTTAGKRVRDVVVTSNGAESRDLSILSAHLFEGETIEEWAFAKDPDGLVWAVRSDGVLLCFTYLKEHDVYAWTRCITDGTVESVCTVVEDNVSILYMIVARTLGDPTFNGGVVRYVERMPSRYFVDAFDEWCLDCANRYNGWNTTAGTLTISGATYNQGDTVTLTNSASTFAVSFVGRQYILRIGQAQVTVTTTGFTDTTHMTATLNQAPAVALQNVATSDWALASTTLGGMWHLEGQTVSVVADGAVLPDAVVTNGTVTIAQARGRILAGFGFVCDLETLDIESQPTLQGRQKKVSELTIRVKNTRGLKAGPTSDRLTPFKERTTENFGYALSRTTGDEKLTLDPSWNTNGRVFIRQENPLAATLVAIIPKIDVGA